MESSEEVTIVVKTRSSLIEKLTKNFKENHSYYAPCVLAIPVKFAEKDYAEWMLREISPDA